METRQFMAMKGLVLFQGKVLVLRESLAYNNGVNKNKYGVPGGRMEIGERFDDCLRREIKEETGLEVSIGKPFFVGEWRPVVRGEQWQITGVFFECFCDTENVVLSSDHDDFQWINPKEYKKYEILDDEIPVFEAYQELSSK